MELAGDDLIPREKHKTGLKRKHTVPNNNKKKQIKTINNEKFITLLRKGVYKRKTRNVTNQTTSQTNNPRKLNNFKNWGINPINYIREFIFEGYKISESRIRTQLNIIHPYKYAATIKHMQIERINKHRMNGTIMSHQAIKIVNEIRNADQCLPFTVAIFDEPQKNNTNWTTINHSKDEQITFVIKCTSTKIMGITHDKLKIAEGSEWRTEIRSMSMEMVKDHEYLGKIHTQKQYNFVMIYT